MFNDDKALIRTLLLTFFFRHMPKLIEHGYLYIAQPPLYKVKKGSSEVYLKNEHALQNHIIDNALNGAILKAKSGDRSGKDLHDFVAKLGKFSQLISNISPSRAMSGSIPISSRSGSISSLLFIMISTSHSSALRKAFLRLRRKSPLK
jgi:DNA gyrase subunit B